MLKTVNVVSIRWHLSIFPILFRPFGLFAPKIIWSIWVSKRYLYCRKISHWFVPGRKVGILLVFSVLWVQINFIFSTIDINCILPAIWPILKTTAKLFNKRRNNSGSDRMLVVASYTFQSLTVSEHGSGTRTRIS